VCLLVASLAAANPVTGATGAPGEEPRELLAREVVEVELSLPGGSDPRRLTELFELVMVRRGQVLSPLAVRRSIEGLWHTGRFSDVVARVVEVPGGVQLIFELTPVQVLDQLVIEGNVILSDEEIREVSGLQEDGPLDPDTLDSARAAIEAAYALRGYEQARVRVSSEPSPGGVALILELDEGQPTRLARLTLTGSLGLPVRQLMEALGMEVGAVFDRAQLDVGLERLRAELRAQRYYRARVGDPIVTLEKGRATVALPVSAGPRYSFHFHGNHRFPSAILTRVLAYDGTEVLDPVLMGQLARRLSTFYRYRGFHDVRINPREVRRPDHQEAVLAFHIEEGHPLTVRQVRFQGNRALPSGVLREVLAERIRASEPQPDLELSLRDDPLEIEGRGGRKPQSLPLAPDARTVFVEEAYLEAAEVLTDAYRERGFPEAQVRFSQLELDVEGRTAVAEFEVQEGPETRVGQVDITGLPPGLEQASFLLTKGKSLSEEAVAQARQDLVRTLSRAGYLYARVEVEAQPGGEDPWDMKVSVRVDPGPQVLVGAIIVQGLARTDENTVKAQLGLASGKTLDREALAEGRRQLARLNIFRQVEVQLRDPNRPKDVKDILVTVQERPRIDGEVSGGYFLVEGPRIALDAAFPNVDSRGLNLLARGKVNYVGWSAEALSGRYSLESGQDASLQGWQGLGGRGSVSLSQPRLNVLLPLEVGARMDFIGERYHRPSYLSTRFAVVAGMDWAAASWLSVSLQYELEHNRLRSRNGVLQVPSRADEERLRFPYGVFTLHSLRPSATLDFRDNPANPRKGLLVSTSAEFTRDLSVAPADALGNAAPDFPINEVKLSGSVSVYMPLGKRASVAFSGRAGTIVQLSDGAQSIGSKLFYLGGSSSLRGFREDGVLPDDLRGDVRQQLLDCRAIIDPSSCPAALEAVLSGQAPVSQGGEVFTLGKAEVRLPVFSSLDLGVFFEAGNLWVDRTKFDVSALRPTAGVGLRYVTPVGPLAFDLGFNLDRDEDFNEPSSQFHFSIGVF